MYSANSSLEFAFFCRDLEPRNRESFRSRVKFFARNGQRFILISLFCAHLKLGIYVAVSLVGKLYFKFLLRGGNYDKSKYQWS